MIAALALLLSSTPAVPAQDGEPPEAPAAAPIALKVGHIHPVSGPVIENGVIVIRGGRIFSIGKADAVRIPRSATVLDFPNAHAYPGLVDAQSSAFAGARESGYGNGSDVNAGTDFADALDPSDEESRKLVRYGITTAYVSNQSQLTWRGLGALVRPTGEGFGVFADKKHGGLSLRMTTGAADGHALDRLRMFDKTGNAFDGLDEYEKQQADYKKALEEYAKKRKEWLDHFSKASGKEASKPTEAGTPAGAPGGKPGEKPAEKTTGGAAPPPGERPTGRTGGGPPERRRTGADSGEGRGTRTPGASRRRFGRGGPEGNSPAGSRPTQPAGGPKAPERPTYPKPVKADPAKEALLRVVKGTLPLRVEVHRHDEIRAALFMAVTKELPAITLENATAGGDIAKEIAEAGAPVVISDLLPGAASYEKTRDGSLAGKLHAAGVQVAIGSGSVRNARNLTLMAAYASGQGLPRDAAVEALTLTPAKILGVGDKVGSLERNKLADVLITSGPLLDSGTKVLRVFSAGRSVFEASPQRQN